MVVRPEHAELVKRGGKADLWGKLETIVYFGTDTHFHVKLDGGADFIVRQQNRAAAATALRKGDAVGIKLEDHAAQVLRD